MYQSIDGRSGVQASARRLPKGTEGGSRPSSRLDRWTNYNRTSETPTAERCLTVRHYPNVGTVQIGWATFTRGGKPGKRGCSQNRDENEKRAIARAKANVYRAMLEIEADRMLTLTTRACITSRPKFLGHVQAFERRVRRKYSGFQVVGCTEAQKRGALHIHLGISGFHDVTYLRRCWRQVVGEGNIDISFKPDGKGNRFTKAARYMSKYIGKDMDTGREFGEHRYHASRGIERRCERIPIDFKSKADEAQMAVETASALLGEDLNLWGFNRRVFGYLSAEKRQWQRNPKRWREPCST